MLSAADGEARRLEEELAFGALFPNVLQLQGRPEAWK